MLRPGMWDWRNHAVDRHEDHPYEPDYRSIPLAFQHGDAQNVPFADQSFDLVYARYLLLHLPDPTQVLKEMIRVCKSGGIVAVQEPDLTTGPVCYPPNWAFEKTCALTQRLVADAQLGRKFLHLFRQIGYASLHLQVDTILDRGERDTLGFWRLTAEGICPVLITQGMIGHDDAQHLCDEMRRFEQQTDVLFVSSHIFSGWAVRT
jgi:SAM-dependent methyltransferase